MIESSPLTNTGYGSSLNLLGKVECDASFITNDKIGAVVNMSCKNPTKELFRVFQYLDTLYESDRNRLNIASDVDLSTIEKLGPTYSG